MMDQLLTKAECKDIAKDDGDIVGIDDENGTEHTIRWQRKPMALTNPHANAYGVSGYCYFDGEAGPRVHICAHINCKARHKTASKYAGTGPPRAHLRTKTTVPAPPPAPAPAPPPEPTPIDTLSPTPLDPTPLASPVPSPLYIPPSVPHAVPAAVPLDAPSYEPVVHPSVPPNAAGPSCSPHSPHQPAPSLMHSSPSPAHSTSSSSRSSSPSSESAVAGEDVNPDIGAVAPPPPPFVPPASVCLPAPPGRATLQPVKAANPTTLPQQPPKTSANKDDGGCSVVTELKDPVVAKELSDFMTELLTDGQYTGIAAFVLFSIVFKRRVAIWNHNERRDIINDYASWANDFVTRWAVIEVISCKGHGGNIYSHHDQVHTMNHWVAGVEDENDLLELLTPDIRACIGEGKQLPEDEPFYELYHFFITYSSCEQSRMATVA